MSLTVDQNSAPATATDPAHDTTSRRRPEVLRRDGHGPRGRVIDLRRPAAEGPSIIAQGSRVTVLRDRDPRTRRSRVSCGRDSDSPLMWQRIAEAVLAARPGDTVAVDVSELAELSQELIEFLRFADYQLSRRGGIFLLDPSSDAVFTHVRFGA